MNDYLYDVFLSFTGADRELKDTVKNRLGEMGLSFYDSDMYCKGQFRDDFCEALDKSRVYLMILTDNLRNDPLITQKGRLTEVRRECNLACDLESTNQLNIIILCMSEFFRFSEPFHDYNDKVGWYFYSVTRGFSQVFGTVDENGVLSEKSLEEITSRCASFVEKRNAGKPVLSQMPKLEIATEQLIGASTVMGREDRIKEVLDAFAEGKQAVVLEGLGGMGKTTVAMEIARVCEEMGYLKCPQIVRVQELCTDRGGLNTIVSSVAYEKSVYDSLISLPERDKYERKLRALSALPETVLLIVDNFNNLRSKDLTDILARLKCRLLITTRAHVEIDTRFVSRVTIEPLNEGMAREMFEEVYGKNVSVEGFRPLYEYVGGHTITLCIMAKMIRQHHMSIERLLDEMKDFSKMEAKVDFYHNEYGDSDTVLGHLQNLFSISNFGEGALRILRSMCILGDGLISSEDLVNALSLTNRNDILELASSGWIEIQSLTSGGVEQEYLYLHPILSRLVAMLLKPTEETVPEMINYLISYADKAKDHLTYADASVLNDRLYYACFVLAGGSHRLSRELWNRFVAVDRLLGDASATTKRVESLVIKMENPEEIQRVRAYGDMIILEQHPTRIDILDKYVTALDGNTADYKWVMRCLSVTIGHIAGVEKHRETLEKIIEKALAVAMDKRDDLAVVSMMPYFTFTDKSAVSLRRQLKTYVKLRKKEGANDGIIIWLEGIADSFAVFNAKRVSDVFNTSQAVLNSIAEGSYSIYGSFFRHPIVSIRLGRLSQKIENGMDANPDDVLFQILGILYGETLKFVEGDKLDANTYIQALVNYHFIQLENNVTLTSAADAVMAAISSLKLFPEASVQHGVWELGESVDMDNISVQALSSLQVAALINRAYKDKKAIKQAKELINVVRRLRPEGHSDILAAIQSYGEICAVFGENRAALGAYIDVYNHLAVNDPDSAKLADVARKMLYLDSLEKYSLKTILAVAKNAVANYKNTERYLYEVLWHFVVRVFGKAKKEYGSSDFQEVMDYLWNTVDEAQKDLGSMTLTAQEAMLSLLGVVSDLSVNKSIDVIFEESQARTKKLLRSRKKQIRISAKARLLKNNAYKAYHANAEDREKLLDAAASFCVKHKTDRYLANICAWLFFTLRIPRHLPEGGEGASALFSKIISSPSLMKKLESLTEEFQTKGIYLGDYSGGELRDAEIRYEITRTILVKGVEEHITDLCIPYRTYKKIRTVEQFYGAALEYLLRDAIEKYEEHPVVLRNNEP